MRQEVLNKNQSELLPVIQKFSNVFGLVGGTALALQLGHRRSIDFDLFSHKSFDNEKIRNQIRQERPIEETIVENRNELTVAVNGVKLTFYRYPFKVNFSLPFENIIKVPKVTVLAAMKAFALGRRAKWKDYVDLYFVLKGHSLAEVTHEAEKIFGVEFNEKLFRVQLAYFNDIDYSEEVEYLPGLEVGDFVIKDFLSNVSLQS